MVHLMGSSVVCRWLAYVISAEQYSCHPSCWMRKGQSLAMLLQGPCRKKSPPALQYHNFLDGLEGNNRRFFLLLRSHNSS
ncbi:hypothetical protein F4811DRAFT_430181 [Daldinia bambusicola]|nr:hypothetical protein F4811DRAFT_430181 [Daldinia bambusicola]